MRSDEQRDKCLDILIAKVQTLENEVAKLKGESFVENKISIQKDRGIEIPDTILVPNARPNEKESSQSDSGLENAIGTRWIGRIGALAIIFGVAFFLKYSFDNKLIGETGRIIMGILSGSVFITIGVYLQEKKNMGLYGQILSGCGLAILYLALYAAFALYHLIPSSLASAGMIVVTTTGMVLATRYSAYSLVAITLLGGFLTPVMLSTGQNQPLTLFGYILLLDAGTLFLASFKRWPLLAIASLLGTAIIYISWHSQFYTDTQRWLAFGIVLIFFLFYNFYILISQFDSQNDDTLNDAVYDQFLILGSAAFFFLAFFAQYRGEIVWPVKIFALSMAIFEIILAIIIKQIKTETDATIVTYASASVIFTVIATFIILEQRWIMPALAAEMAALGWIGLSMNLPILRKGAYALGLIVLILFGHDVNFQFEPFQKFIPVLNSRFLVCAFVVTCFYIFLYITALYRENLDREEYIVSKTVFVITQALSLILLSYEIHDSFLSSSPRHVMEWTDPNYAYQLSLSVLWAFYASILTGIGIVKRIRGVRMMGILLLGITILKVFLMDLSALETFYRIISFIILGLLLLAVSYGYNRFKDLIFGDDDQ
jgi:uncharacterized membrane protein